jgi:hypothetical protein
MALGSCPDELPTCATTLNKCAVPVAGAIAGASVAAAYLDAKFHITKDISTIRGVSRQERDFAKAGECPATTTWVFDTESDADNTDGFG